MADKLKEIPAKILEWWNKFTTRQKSIIIGAAAVVIFAFAIIMYVMSKPQYVRLVTCETTAQASEIIDTLDSAGIAHRESNRGVSRKLPIDKETVNGYVNTVKANGWNISVSYLRAKKKNDLDRIMGLYGNANERYW